MSQEACRMDEYRHGFVEKDRVSLRTECESRREVNAGGPTGEASATSNAIALCSSVGRDRNVGGRGIKQEEERLKGV